MQLKSGMTPGAFAGNYWPSVEHGAALPAASHRRSGVLEQPQAQRLNAFSQLCLTSLVCFSGNAICNS